MTNTILRFNPEERILATSSWIRDMNTPQSNSVSDAWYVVVDINNNEYEIKASCPITAMEAYNSGAEYFPRRDPKNLNRAYTNYSIDPEEQLAYQEMQDASFKLAEVLLGKESGAYAHIQGCNWWVSPVNQSLEVACSPDSIYTYPNRVTVFMINGFDGQGVDDLKSTKNAIEAWLMNPVVEFGNQDLFDAVVSYFQASTEEIALAI